MEAVLSWDAPADATSATAQVWDPRTGTVLATYRGALGGAAAARPDASVLFATARGRNTLHLYRWGKVCVSLSVSVCVSVCVSRRVCSFSLSLYARATSLTLAHTYTHSLTHAHVRIVQDQAQVRQAGPETLTAVALSPSGLWGAGAAATGRIYLWQARPTACPHRDAAYAQREREREREREKMKHVLLPGAE
jgi:hypothetical protein